MHVKVWCMDFRELSIKGLRHAQKRNSFWKKKEEQKEPENYAFVDGSFNSATSVYGYGGFLVTKGERHVISGSGNDPQMASMRNVAGEVLGSMAAVKEAVAMGLTDLTIYYDYMGIEMWATGAWKRNKQGTIAYYDFIQSVNDKISLHFVKVKGHSGVEGNEEALVGKTCCRGRLDRQG